MKNMKNLITVLSLLIGMVTFAQPPNDFCSGALTTTPDGTCYGPGLPETTTVGSADNWVGTIGCAANNAEVWFSFVATESQIDINITSGTLGGDIEFVLVSSASPPCGGLSLVGSSCGGSPLTTAFNGLQIGTTYYYTISSTGSDGTFTTCLTSSTPVPTPGQDCPEAAILCDGDGFAQGTSDAGFGVQEINTGNTCWGSGGERQSKWFHFTIGCSGTLEFNINPVTSGDDYDWAIFDITGDLTCGTMGNSVNCNWSGCKGSTGITTCPSATGEPGRITSGAGCFGGPAAWETLTMNVIAGETYALLVDNYSTSNDGFSLTFGGACGGGTAVIGPDANFTGSIDVTCMEFTGFKTCITTNSTYLWDYGDGTTSNGMDGSHTYTTDGNYTISLTVTDALGCVRTTSQTFDIGCVALPIELFSFDGHIIDRNNLITWTTTTEINNNYFLLKKSPTFTFDENSVISIIEGAGTTTTEHTYNYLDIDVEPKINYYQLTQVDYNGESTTSNIISIDNRVKERELLKVVNYLGQEVNENTKGFLILIYNDGTLERVFR